MDLITIAIPVYNVEKYVEKSLLSALNQTYSNLEILIIDDKGNDDSIQIVDKVRKEHKRGSCIKIIDHIVNRGTGMTKNSAMEKASGKYIFFLDSDDYISDNCIESLHEKMVNTNVDVVISSYDVFYSNVSKKEICKNKKLDGNSSILNEHYNGENKMPVFTWNKLYSIDFLRKNHIKCIPNHINEDDIFTFQILLNISSCIYFSGITYHYRLLRPNSTSSICTSRNYSKASRLAQQYKEISIFKKRYIAKYRSSPFYSRILKDIMNENFKRAYMIFRYRNLRWKEKLKDISILLTYPLNFKEIKQLKNNRISNITFWSFAKLPLCIKLFFLIPINIITKHIDKITQK